MPRHRGDLTASEFAQNFNDLMHYKHISYNKHLGPDGKWVDDPYDGTPITIMMSGIPLPDFQITETNGVVTKIFFEINSDKPDAVFDDFLDQIHFAVASYVCAQNGVNCFNEMSVLSEVQPSFNTYTFSEAGITVTSTAEYSGYDQFMSNTLIPRENEKQHLHLVFSMEKTG